MTHDEFMQRLIKHFEDAPKERELDEAIRKAFNLSHGTQAPNPSDEFFSEMQKMTEIGRTKKG